MAKMWGEEPRYPQRPQESDASPSLLDPGGGLGGAPGGASGCAPALPGPSEGVEAPEDYQEHGGAQEYPLQEGYGVEQGAVASKADGLVLWELP